MKKVIYLLSIIVLIVVASCKKASIPGAGILVNDSLTSSTSGWFVSSSTNDTFAFNQGHYEVELHSSNNLAFCLAPYNKITFPYTVQIDGTIQLQDTTAGKIAATDLIFNRVDDNNYSRVEVWSNGQYRVWTNTDGTQSLVANFTSFSGINSGNNGKNTIEVIQNATNMEMLLNGSFVDSFSIALPSSKVTVGPGVTTASASYSPAIGWFNNFILSKN